MKLLPFVICPVVIFLALSKMDRWEFTLHRHQGSLSPPSWPGGGVPCDQWDIPTTRGRYHGHNDQVAPGGTVFWGRSRIEGGGLARGGGGGTDSLKVGIPTAKLPPLLFGPVHPSVFFDRPLFLRVTDYRPPKSDILKKILPTKLIKNSFSKLSTQ